MNPQKSTSFPPQTSPSIPWGSPALRPNASFPPAMNSTPPHRPPVQMGMNRSFGPGTVSPRGSPQFGNPFHCSFRTPQPQSSHRSPNAPRGPWSESRGHRGNRYQRNDSNGSRFDSPSVNPGGSDNIQNYCSPQMMKDPWIDTPPQPVDYWTR